MRRYFPFVLVVFILMGGMTMSSKKVKNTFTIPKIAKNDKKVRDRIDGREISMEDTVGEKIIGTDLIDDLKGVSFAGYDKESNSNKESFMLINGSGIFVTGFKVRIDYLDMQGRMLHSRIVKDPCFVPPGETRRIDIKSWDLQHTYYYYLGNEPKRVATPFQVRFEPISFWVEEDKD